MKNCQYCIATQLISAVYGGRLYVMQCISGRAVGPYVCRVPAGLWVVQKTQSPMKSVVYLLCSVLCAATPAFSQIQVDYRAYQSPVKNQQKRGTCTAFAALAAMETLPGFPTDLSEQ